MMRPVEHLILFFVLALLTGCASSPAGAPSPEQRPDRTAAMVDLYIVDADERTYVRYHVEPDGDLRFAGGVDAIEARYSWTGPLTDEEIVRLEAIVADLPTKPIRLARGERPARMAKVEAVDGDDRRKFEVPADDARIAGLHTLLETASRRRYAKLLDSLPKPGPQP